MILKSLLISIEFFKGFSGISNFLDVPSFLSSSYFISKKPFNLSVTVEFASCKLSNMTILPFSIASVKKPSFHSKFISCSCLLFSFGICPPIKSEHFVSSVHIK